MTKPAKIFIIGDKEDGLTIVVTDPVLIVHYTKQDLIDQGLGNRGRAAIVRHLLPQLRGVDVPKMLDYNEEVIRDGHGAFTRDEEAAYHREVHFADTVAQHIADGCGVFDVDFCVAVDVEDTCDLVLRGRVADTVGSAIGNYLDENSGCKSDKPKTVPNKPHKFDVGDIDEDGLTKPAPWKR